VEARRAAWRGRRPFSRGPRPPRGVRTLVTASAGNPVTVHGPDPAAPGPRRARLARGAAWMPLIPALVTLAVTLYQIQRPSLWRGGGAAPGPGHPEPPPPVRHARPTPRAHRASSPLLGVQSRGAGHH